MTSEEKHEQVVELLAKRVRGTPTVRNLTGDRVFAEGDPLAKTATLPRVTVSRGSLRDVPPSDKPILRQANVVTLIEAGDEAQALKLAGILRRLVTSAGFEVNRRDFAMHDTGAPRATNEAVTVRDLYATHVVHAPDEAAE